MLVFCYEYIYIYAFSRRFYPKRLTLHSSYSFYILSAHDIAKDFQTKLNWQAIFEGIHWSNPSKRTRSMKWINITIINLECKQWFTCEIALKIDTA